MFYLSGFLFRGLQWLPRYAKNNDWGSDSRKIRRLLSRCGNRSVREETTRTTWRCRDLCCAVIHAHLVALGLRLWGGALRHFG